MSKILLLIFAAVFANNVVFSRGIGFDSAEKSSDNFGFTLKYSVLFIVSAGIASVLAWILRLFVIVPLELSYMRAVIYTLTVIVSALVPAVILEFLLPKIYKNSGVSEKIFTSFALFGIVFIIDSMGADLVTSVLYGVFTAVGMVLASVVFASIKVRLETADVPRSMRGVPIILVSAGIIALIFAELAKLTF